MSRRDLIRHLGPLLPLAVAVSISSDGVDVGTSIATAGAATALLVAAGRPWTFAPLPREETRGMLIVALLLVFGAATEIALLAAVAWVLGLWIVFAPLLREASRNRLRALLPLALLAVPWVVNDLSRLAWWFRLSAAEVVEFLLGAGGWAVRRMGTSVLVRGMAISVEPACAGLGTMQLMLVAGLGAAALAGRSLLRPGLWIVLLCMTWVANTSRVAMLAFWSLAGGACGQGTIVHDWGGAAVVVAVFFVARVLFSRDDGTGPGSEFPETAEGQA